MKYLSRDQAEKSGLLLLDVIVIRGIRDLKILEVYDICELFLKCLSGALEL